MLNLTLAQMEYLKITIYEKSKSIRLENLKKLLNDVEIKKMVHNNKSNYIYKINDKGYIFSDYDRIKCIQDGCEYGSYFKWKYSTLLNSIKEDIYFLEFSELQNIVGDLYFNKIRNMWFNDEQFKIIIKLFKLTHITSNGNLTVKRDSTDKIYGMYQDDKEIIAIKDGDITYLINKRIESKKEIIKNKEDLLEIKELIEIVRNYEFIKPCYLISQSRTNKDDCSKLLMSDFISNDLKALKKYFNKNILPNINFKDKFEHSISF